MDDDFVNIYRSYKARISTAVSWLLTAAQIKLVLARLRGWLIATALERLLLTSLLQDYPKKVSKRTPGASQEVSTVVTCDSIIRAAELIAKAN